MEGLEIKIMIFIFSCNYNGKHCIMLGKKKANDHARTCNCMLDEVIMQCKSDVDNLFCAIFSSDCLGSLNKIIISDMPNNLFLIKRKHS